MAIDNPTERTAESGGYGDAGKRHLVIGTNVAVAVVLAVAATVLINWLAGVAPWRKDLSALGRYGVSERTAQILRSTTQPVTVTTLYTSVDPEYDRAKYLPRVEDLLDDMRQRFDHVEVQVVDTNDQKRSLIQTLRGSFSQTAGEHAKVIEDYRALAQALSQALTAQQTALAALQRDGAWMSTFKTFPNVQIRTREMLTQLDKTGEEIDALISGGELPRYGEANRTIKDTLADAKKLLEAAQEWFDRLGALAKAVADDPDHQLAVLSEGAGKLPGLLDPLDQILGTTDDPVPAEPHKPLTKFAEAVAAPAETMEQVAEQLDTLAEKLPAIQDHPDFSVIRQVAIFREYVPLPEALAPLAESLRGFGPQVQRIVADAAVDQQQRAIRDLRRFVAELSAQAAEIAGRMAALNQAVRAVDTPSRRFLTTGGESKRYAQQIEAIDQLTETIDDLDEPKIETVADELDDPNIVIVQAGDDIRVVGFDDVWPQGRSFGPPGADAQPRRVFNGDEAISSTVLSLTRPPFATVVFAYFEQEVPPQMRQYMPPPRSSIPVRQLSVLRERLEAANFKTVDWNMATSPEPPEPAEGTDQRVYLFLPPSESMPNPMGGPDQGPKFGEEQVEAARAVLKDGGRALFLSCFEFPRRGQWGMPMPSSYGWESLLADDWGVDVKFRYRVIEAEADPSQPNRYGLSVMDWFYMRLNNFTDHPIGKPLRNRLMQVRDACPVVRAETVPEGVTVEPILRVPDRDDVWADNDVERLIRYLEQAEGGWIKDAKGDEAILASTPGQKPFSVAVAAERSSTRSKLVVLGTGLSLIDGYLDQKIVRTASNDRVVFDPPPTANADLVVNCLFWLTDHDTLIAAGPVDIRPVQPDAASPWLKVLVLVFWPVLAVVIGGVVMSVRRK